MHPRDRNGWGGILPSEDLTNDAESTDPNLEMPKFDVGSEEKTTIAHNPTLPPQKQKQRQQKPKLTLPRPESHPSGARPPPPAVEFAVEVDQIVSKLEPEKKEPKKKEERLFTKEVILTLAGGLLLLGGAFAYSRSDDAPQSTLPIAPPPPLAPVTPPPPPVVETKVEEAPPPPQETTVKSATPLLSILSIPSGARVEIDGTIYGNTPLIQPSPPNVKSMAIRLLKDNFKNYETILTPNEAGHFNLNATLEKR